MNDSAAPVHAFGNDVLGDHDATALAALLKSREISVAEVVAAAIARSDKVNPQLNAIQFTCFERARNTAGHKPEGLFAGVPTFIKDNTQLAGLPTSHGAQAFVSLPARTTDPFARQYLAQGFVCLGKSRLPEFGFNASTEFMGLPPTRNPWNTAYSPGASSGGSAVLVASGVVPIAHANDGGGSIRIPAACCGLVGLKPTRGRLLSPEMSRQLPINLASEGVVTRSVRDTANFYAEAERYHKDAGLPALGLVEGPGRRRLRVGLAYDSIMGTTDTGTRATVEATALLLQGLGHEVTEIALPIPASFASDFSVYWGLLAFMVSTFGKQMLDPEFAADRLDNLSKGLAALYRRKALTTPMVLYRLKQIRQTYASMFEHCDVVLSPVLAHTTPRLGYLSPELDFDTLFGRLLQYVSFTPLNNIAGGPGISLPMGATENGLPIGVHMSARDGDERSLLELAFELEAAKPWRRIQDVVAGS